MEAQRADRYGVFTEYVFETSESMFESNLLNTDYPPILPSLHDGGYYAVGISLYRDRKKYSNDIEEFGCDDEGNWLDFPARVRIYILPSGSISALVGDISLDAYLFGTEVITHFIDKIAEMPFFAKQFYESHEGITIAPESHVFSKEEPVFVKSDLGQASALFEILDRCHFVACVQVDRHFVTIFHSNGEGFPWLLNESIDHFGGYHAMPGLAFKNLEVLTEFLDGRYFGMSCAVLVADILGWKPLKIWELYESSIDSPQYIETDDYILDTKIDPKRRYLKDKKEAAQIFASRSRDVAESLFRGDGNVWIRNGLGARLGETIAKGFLSKK